jgi:hypothetical protein
MANNKDQNKDDFRTDRFTWKANEVKFIPPEKNTKDQQDDKNK